MLNAGLNKTFLSFVYITIADVYFSADFVCCGVIKHSFISLDFEYHYKRKKGLFFWRIICILFFVTAEDHKWLTCSANRQAHEAEKLMLTQIIPSDGECTEHRDSRAS